MKQIHGKVLLFILLSINLFANVVATVQPQSIYKGDSVTFTITASGEDIKFPEINEIEGFRVQGTSTSQSIQMINTSITKTTSKSYIFKPTKTISIPSYSVEVDGQTFNTNPLKVEVVKQSASKNGEPFVLELKVDKNSVYVGEPIDLSVILKQRLDAHADQIRLGEPKLENFWIKKVDDVENGRQKDYVVQTLHYQLFPQKEGNYTIPAIEAMIGQKSQRHRGDMFDDPFFGGSLFGQELTWKRIYSNEVKVNVKALPEGLELYGDFHIDAKVDKTKVQANKPVNLTVVVSGEGNIDDVKKFEPTLDNAIVYADEPTVTSYQNNNTFTQKIAIIADRNITIPPLTLKFFDKNSKRVKTIKTKPIDIEVVGGQKSVAKATNIEVSPNNKIEVASSTTPKVVEKVVTKTEDAYLKYLFGLLGLLLGAVVTYLLLSRNKTTKAKESDMVKAIRKAKTDRELFDLLLPHSKANPVIGKNLNLLEENLYRGAKHTIDKEDLMEVFEEME